MKARIRPADCPILTSRHGKPLVTQPAVPRQESVRLALEKPAASIMGHCSRCVAAVVSRNLAVRVLEAAKRHSAAVCGIGLTDTVKAVIPSGHEELWFVHSTLSRDGIVLVQTPQVFGLSLLRQCHEMARRDGFIGTDDGQLVERFGHKLAIVKGERTNFKVTFPEDFEMLSMILEKQGNDLESAGRDAH